MYYALTSLKVEGKRKKLFYILYFLNRYDNTINVDAMKSNAQKKSNRTILK